MSISSFFTNRTKHKKKRLKASFFYASSNDNLSNAQSSSIQRLKTYSISKYASSRGLSALTHQRPSVIQIKSMPWFFRFKNSPLNSPQTAFNFEPPSLKKLVSTSFNDKVLGLNIAKSYLLSDFSTFMETPHSFRILDAVACFIYSNQRSAQKEVMKTSTISSIKFHQRFFLPLLSNQTSTPNT